MNEYDEIEQKIEAALDVYRDTTRQLYEQQEALKCRPGLRILKDRANPENQADLFEPIGSDTDRGKLLTQWFINKTVLIDWRDRVCVIDRVEVDSSYSAFGQAQVLKVEVEILTRY